MLQLRSNVLLTMALLSLISIAVVGCGAGDSRQSANDDNAPRHGTVAVLMTDAPDDEFAQINVTVSQIDLLSEGGHATLFTGESTFDLLTLESFFELLSITPDVPAGDYSKIRLTLTLLELVLHTGEKFYPALPAGGTLDLVARSTFSVNPGEILVVEIDIDANKSIHTVQTGTGDYLFRPVVFVDVASEAPSKLVRLLGYIRTRPNMLEQTFEVCRVVTDDAGFPMIFFETCMIAALAPGGSVFSPDGAPGDFANLRVEQFVMIAGTINVENEGMLEAAVIEMLGWVFPGNFVTFGGTIDSAPVLGEFDFAPEPNPDTSDPMITVRLQEGTKVFSAAGDPLDLGAISRGVDAEIAGVLSTAATQPDTLWSALVILDTGAPLEQLVGQIAAVGANDYTVDTVDGPTCLRLAKDAELQLITQTATSTSSEPGDTGDLQPGRDIDASGAVTPDACFEAQSVVIFVAG
jgi:hypothetical protein